MKRKANFVQDKMLFVMKNKINAYRKKINISSKVEFFPIFYEEK